MRKQMSRVVMAIFAAMLFYAPVCIGQAPLPSVDLRALNAAIQRHFGSIDEIRTVGMTDNPGGRFDVIVVGSRLANDGWRVEVFSVSHHRLTSKWDSVAMARESEYANSGPKSVTIRTRDYDYDLLIAGCVPHLCSDGISGFVLFSGKSNQTSKAKVTTLGLDQPYTASPKYDVMFSKNISAAFRQTLEGAICSNTSISNKGGLPFECKKP